jgi:uncharacterized Ntn-hydrolase superfamily protein
VAVQSHWFSVGTAVPWARAGIGAIATQAMVNISYGPRGLDMLSRGQNAERVVQQLTDADEGRDLRQLAIIDARGGVSAWTGRCCIKDAGHIISQHYSVQANMMLNDKVPHAMADAFESASGPLAERMVVALEAAQEVGGDIRGKQSAALIVVRGKPTGMEWEDRLVDLRVDDHEEPIVEMKRLLSVHRAYERMNAGDVAMEKGNMEAANSNYQAAEGMFPQNAEMRFWHAVTLVNNGEVDKALPLFAEVFRSNGNWRLLCERLMPSGLLKVDDAGLKKILQQ